MSGSAPATVALDPEVSRLAPALSSLRRTLHRLPERGFQPVPGCYAFIGSANSVRDLHHPHHSPRFDLDEAALPIGVQMLVRTAERFLGAQAP